MKTKTDAVALVHQQLSCPSGTDPGGTPLVKRPKGRQWHYGKQELRELLDFIYGGPPQQDEETIK